MIIRIAILLIILISNFGNSQINREYKIYLILDSGNKEMITGTTNINKNLLKKSFTFSKNIPREKFLHSFYIDNEGKLTKGIKGETSHVKEGLVSLYHYSKKHRTIHISKLLNTGVIRYGDFINAEFKSFLDVLKGASKIYVIDLKEEDPNSLTYIAYEVSLSS